MGLGFKVTGFRARFRMRLQLLPMYMGIEYWSVQVTGTRFKRWAKALAFKYMNVDVYVELDEYI